MDGWLHDGKLYLRVVDYKTGKKAFDLSDLRYGLGIQMLCLFTLEKGRNYFGYPIVPAGALYHPAQREVILKKDRGIQPEKLGAALQGCAAAAWCWQDGGAAGYGHGAPGSTPLSAHSGEEGTAPFPTASHRRNWLEAGPLYVEDLLHQIAREIGSGNVDADPVARLGAGPVTAAILLRPVPSRRAGAAIGCAISGL